MLIFWSNKVEQHQKYEYNIVMVKRLNKVLNKKSFNTDINDQDLSCNAFEALLGEYVDNQELSAHITNMMSLHLFDCSECKKLHRQYLQIIETAKLIKLNEIEQFDCKAAEENQKHKTINCNIDSEVKSRLRDALTKELGLKFN